MNIAIKSECMVLKRNQNPKKAPLLSVTSLRRIVSNNRFYTRGSKHWIVTKGKSRRV